MAIIELPIIYVPDPLKGRPLFNGQIFVGEPDLDPEVVINQKQLNVVEEDGTVVPVSQPFVVGAGGVPVHNGSTVRLDVDGNYSLKILDNLGAQKYFIENVFEGTPLKIEDLSLFTNYEMLTISDMENSLLPDGNSVTIKEGDIIATKASLTGNGGAATYDTVLTSSVTPLPAGSTQGSDIIVSITNALLSFVIRVDNGSVDLRQLSVIDDEDIDSRAVIQAAIKFTSTNLYTLTGSSLKAGMLPVVPDSSNAVNWAENFTYDFNDVEWKLLGETFNGAAVSSPLVDPGVDNTSVRTDNVNGKGLTINCNDVAGENGLGCLGDNCSFSNRYINVRQSATRAGGKAIQMETLSRKGVVFPISIIENCDIGISQQAAENDSIHNIRDIVYEAVIMRNVAIPFLTVNTFSAATDHIGDTRKSSFIIHNLDMYNCGKVDWNNITGTPGGLETEAGMILSDRGFGIRIDSFRWINEDSYGEVGAIVRGSIFNAQLNDGDINALKISDLLNFNAFPAGVLSAAGSGASFANTVFAENINVRNCDFDSLVADKASPDTREIQLELIIDTDIATSLDLNTIGALVSSTYTSSANGFIEIRDIKNSSQQFFKQTIGELTELNFNTAVSPMTMYKGEEYISTSGGNISKRPSGTMTINHTHEVTTSISTAFGSWFTGLVVLPAYQEAFIGDIPSVLIFSESGTAQHNSGSLGVLGTLSTPPRVLLSRGTTLASADFKVHYEANGTWKDQKLSGTHDGADNAAVLTDTKQDWVVNELVGKTLNNVTDGSTTTVTANTATTVTGVLAGGTDNDWDILDVYSIA